MQKDEYKFEKRFLQNKIIDLQKQIAINNGRIEANKESLSEIHASVSEIQKIYKCVLGYLMNNRSPLNFFTHDEMTQMWAVRDSQDFLDNVTTPFEVFKGENKLLFLNDQFGSEILYELLEMNFIFNIARNKFPENAALQDALNTLIPLLDSGPDKISSLTSQLSDFNTLYSPDLAESLMNQNMLLNSQIESISKKYQESNSIQASASNLAPSISLLGGYAFNLGNFNFITEVGVDLSKSGIGANRNKEIELTNNYNLYLTQKLGYSFLQNTLTYVTAGVGKKDYHAKYDGDYIKLDHKTTLNNLILGFGIEVKAMNNRLGMFFEVNNIIALNKIKTEIGEIKPKSYQARVGFRYYFGVNQNKYSNNVTSIKEIKNNPFANNKNNAESVSYLSLNSNKIDTKIPTKLNNGRFKIKELY